MMVEELFEQGALNWFIGLEWEPQLSLPALGPKPVVVAQGSGYVPEVGYPYDTWIVIVIPDSVSLYTECLDPTVNGFEVRTRPVPFHSLDQALSEGVATVERLFLTLSSDIGVDVGVFFPSPLCTVRNRKRERSQVRCTKHLNLSLCLRHDWGMMVERSGVEEMSSLSFQPQYRGLEFVEVERGAVPVYRRRKWQVVFPFPGFRVHVKVPYRFSAYDLLFQHLRQLTADHMKVTHVDRRTRTVKAHIDRGPMMDSLVETLYGLAGWEGNTKASYFYPVFLGHTRRGKFIWKEGLW